MNGKQRRVAGLLGAIVAVSSLACIATTTLEPGPGSPAVEEACFNARRARSFSPLHERFVYVRVGSNEHYLLTLDAVYLGLPYAAGITITRDFGRVCSDSGATIAFLDKGFPVYCRVVRVEAVGSKEAAERLVKERTTPRPKG